jgi:hypothetical protein
LFRPDGYKNLLVGLRRRRQFLAEYSQTNLQRR